MESGSAVTTVREWYRGDGGGGWGGTGKREHLVWRGRHVDGMEHDHGVIGVGAVVTFANYA